jgi:hypothetical protein
MIQISKCNLAVLTLMQIALASTAVFAQEKMDDSRLAAGVTGGTLGIGVEASYFVNPYLVVRANVTGLSFRYDNLLNYGYNYGDFAFNELSAGALFDIHPFRNGFRTVLGARYTDFKFNESSVNEPSYAVNNNYYMNTGNQLGALHTQITVKNEVAPYFGIGWDSAHHFSSVRDAAGWEGDRFTVSFDLGALYTGGVNVRQWMDAPVPSGSPLSNDLAAESQYLKKTLDKWFLFYPVAMTTFKYRF